MNIFIPKLNLSYILCCIVAITMASWGLGMSLPGIGIGISYAGLLLLFYFMPMLFLKKKITLRHKWVFCTYICLNVVAIRPLNYGKYAPDYLLHLIVLFVFFVVMISLIQDYKFYSRVMLALMITTTVITTVLIYKHMFIYKVYFLSPNLVNFNITGRAGKNTLSFFLAAVFPFAYSYFFHRKNIVGLLCAVVLGFGSLYTMSKMALLSFVGTIILFCIISTKRRIFIIGLLAIVLGTTVGGVGLRTFQKLDNPSKMSEIEKGESKFVDMKSHRGGLMAYGLRCFIEKPLFGHGTSSFRGREETGGSLSHNDYISLLYELGLVGCLLFVMIIFVSLRDLFKIRRDVPPQYRWLWDGQIVALLAVCGMLLFINAFITIPFWFILAGCQVLANCSERSLLSANKPY